MTALVTMVRHVLPAAVVACSAAGASADTCHFGAPGTTVEIRPHPDAWAEVTIINRLAFRSRPGPCVLHHDGQDVVITYEPGPYRDPDEFMIIVPEGLIADPDWLMVEDETSVRVLIQPIRDGAGM